MGVESNASKEGKRSHLKARAESESGIFLRALAFGFRRLVAVEEREWKKKKKLRERERVLEKQTPNCRLLARDFLP